MLKSKKSINTRELKQPTMFLAIIGFWVLLNFKFLERYIRILKIQSTWIETIIACIIVSWIILTSFYASYHLMSFLFSLVLRRRKIKCSYENTPHVAILYTCMNDMNEKSIIASMSQEYPNFTLFILDDSTVIIERERVDALQEKYGEQVTIIRRNKKNGFKAGNLNNALQNIGDDYKYICVVDADELIPPTFLRDSVAIAEGNDNLGFIQASHQQYSVTEYGKRTGDSIDLHWNYFLPARNYYGFVYFYGHGALLRLQAIKAIGGFPEVVSEDIALSSRLREFGYNGYYAHNIKCFEETPPSYSAFRRRNKKVITGTLEYLTKFYPSFFRSKNISIIEKIDLLIASSVIYLPILFVGFLFLLHCLIPLLREDYNPLTAFSFDNKSLYISTTMSMFQPLWKIDSIVFIFFTVFAPFCYLIPNALRSPKKVILYIFRMGTINLSVCLQTFGAALSWFMTKRSIFIPTGDRSQRLSDSTCYLECLMGLGMIAISIIMGSLCLMSVGLSLIIVPALIKNKFNGRFLSISLFFPMLITIIAICCIPFLIFGITGMFAGITLAHY